MRKFLMLALIPIALSACNRPNTAATTAALSATLGAAASTSPKLASAITTVDAKIARASAQISNYCTLARVSLAGASLFGSSTGAVAAARVVVADFCDNPPSDPVSALALIQATVSDLKAAGITGKTVQQLSLHQQAYAAKRLIRLHRSAWLASIVR